MLIHWMEDAIDPGNATYLSSFRPTAAGSFFVSSKDRSDKTNAQMSASITFGDKAETLRYGSWVDSK